MAYHITILNYNATTVLGTMFTKTHKFIYINLFSRF